MEASFGPIIGQVMAVAVRAETLLLAVFAIARSEDGVEWPKKGQTPENRKSEVTCILKWCCGALKTRR